MFVDGLISERLYSDISFVESQRLRLFADIRTDVQTIILCGIYYPNIELIAGHRL